MAAICLVNPKAELARAADALSINIDAAKGIQDVMKSNLGPTGTMKMLVSGAGDIKITKDGNVLLQEMHIKHPTASLIARASTAMDDILGDGTTSTVLFIGELLRQASTYLCDGLHPSILTEGFNTAKAESLKILDQLRVPVNVTHAGLLDVACTSFKTKLHRDLADLLADISVKAVLLIRSPDKNLDLHAIEILSMKHKSATDTLLVQGLVLDHGSRHPDMPKRLENAYILTCNVSMEYEKTEINSSFFYNTTEEREKLITTERIFIEQRVTNIINLKKKLCDNTDKSFVVINQQGIDFISLEMLAKEGIIALRRAKRRNMERLTLACGGLSLNCLNEVAEEHLGFAGLVYEQILGEDKFTFVEQCKIPRSVTILVKGPDKHTLIQIKDALRDGLRAVKNALDDKFVIPGAGTFEITASQELIKFKDSVKGNLRLGIQAYADALLVIPKMLAVNSGFDSLDTIVKLVGEYSMGTGPVGLDVKTGEPLQASTAGIYDNYSVKKEILNSATVIACNLLMVDEIMRAGLLSLKM